MSIRLKIKGVFDVYFYGLPVNKKSDFSIIFKNIL